MSLESKFFFSLFFAISSSSSTARILAVHDSLKNCHCHFETAPLAIQGDSGVGGAESK